MKKWDELSMAERAEAIRIAVKNGLTDLGSIRDKYNEFAEGGSIHIDPSKKGTFTAAASKHGKSVQAFASQVLAHKENYSPAMVKKANFARNASKWKHGDGGNLFEDGGYKIPNKRTKIKTIRINNGVLTGEADEQGNMYWFRNGKYITPNQLKNYKYYDASVKGYRTLGDKASYITNKGVINFTGVKTPLYRPAYEELVKRGTEKQMADYKREEEQNIPLQNQKWITLRTKGKMNLVDVPLNMLDSIAINAGRSNTDFWTDAALIGKESTFAGFSKALNSPYSSTITGVSPHELTNNHAWYDNPEQDYISAINRNYKSFNEGEQIEAEKNMKYALEHGLVKATTPRYSDYMLADAFKRYQVSPTQYNPGQKNYIPMLNGIRQELLGEKQLQEYWNTRGKQEYERGKNE